MSNDDLELNVSDELLWDPKVDSAAIAVAADDGIVTRVKDHILVAY
jgi:hypothetical protein